MSIEYFEYLDPSAYQVSQPGINDSSTSLGDPRAPEVSNTDSHDRSESGTSTSFLARAKDTTLSFFSSCLARCRGRLATKRDDPPTYQEATEDPTPKYVKDSLSDSGIPPAPRPDRTPPLAFPSGQDQSDQRSMEEESARIILRLLLQDSSWNVSHNHLPRRAEGLGYLFEVDSD